MPRQQRDKGRPGPWGVGRCTWADSSGAESVPINQGVVHPAMPTGTPLCAEVGGGTGGKVGTVGKPFLNLPRRCITATSALELSAGRGGSAVEEAATGRHFESASGLLLMFVSVLVTLLEMEIGWNRDTVAYVENLFMSLSILRSMTPHIPYVFLVDLLSIASCAL